MKSISAKPKRRGRPATGRDPTFGLRIPVELIKRVDAWAAAHDISRSEAIRYFVELGLDQRAPWASPQQRRDKAEATNTEARKIIAAAKLKHDTKTTRLKAQREAAAPKFVELGLKRKR